MAAAFEGIRGRQYSLCPDIVTVTRRPVDNAVSGQYWKTDVSTLAWSV
jgi:hypothetical protein